MVLSLGGLTMALPFLLMISGATRTAVDAHSFELLPRFITDDTVLFQKYIEATYNESPSQLRAAWEEDIDTFDQVTLRETLDLDLVQQWDAFIQNAPAHEIRAGFVYTPSSRSRPWLARRFLNHQRALAQGDLAEVNAKLHTAFPSWNAFQVLPADSRAREGYLEPSPWWTAWRTFLQDDAPVWSKGVHNLTGFYHERITKVQGDRDAPRENEITQVEENLDLFIRGVVNPEWVEITPEATSAWTTFLKARHQTLTGLTQATGVEANSWEQVTLAARVADADALKADWLAFLEGWVDLASDTRHEAPLESLTLIGTELAWRKTTGTPPPIRQWDQWIFETHTPELRRLFLTQNYTAAWGDPHPGWTWPVGDAGVLRRVSSPRPACESLGGLCTQPVPSQEHIFDSALLADDHGLPPYGHPNSFVSYATRLRTPQQLLGLVVAGHGAWLFHLPVKRVLRFAAQGSV